MVGNLSEAAAEAIGADGLLCRVGAYYHDIGKTKRPSYFIENQTNIENPHDKIDPALSKSIIVAHARDGVEMLKEYNIPKPIRDIAEQHHGTTLLQYFYHKAKKQAEEKGEKPPEESEYRYPGPNAQTKETAIVALPIVWKPPSVLCVTRPWSRLIRWFVKLLKAAWMTDNTMNAI